MALSQETTFRLLGGAGARGLSGDSLRVLPADPALDFFDACLRRHRVTRDLVADPDQIWDAELEAAPGRLMGLEAHLVTVSRERLVSLTDVLVVVSKADWDRAHSLHGSRWSRHIVGGLQASFEDWCERTDIQRRSVHRPLGVQVVVDGGAQMQGEVIGLAAGEFVTGLLPNLYSGPSMASRPLITVMINLPGVWEGYREVARLYDDQDLLTLGNHWLDNFSHPALRAAALYRLQFDPLDGLVHLSSPDAPGGCSLTRHGDPKGESIYGLTAGDGSVVAWLVLALVDSQPAGPTPVMVEAVPTVDPLGAVAPMGTVAKRVVAEPPDDDLDRPTRVADAGSASSSAAGVPAPATAKATGMLADLVRVREAGVLLQRVHFRDVMSGYEVHVGANGDIGSELSEPAATVQVLARKGGVRLFALVPGIRVGGVAIPVGAAVVLGASVDIVVGEVQLEYRDLSRVRLKGWPYLAELRRVGANVHLPSGSVYVIGREPGSRLKLPDDSHHGNILWRPEVESGSMIQSQNGTIPKSRFTLDSIMVASNHAELDFTGAAPVLRNMARSCYSFIRRGSGESMSWLGLSRVSRPTGSSEAELRSGDEILVGNCVFQLVMDSADVVESAGMPVRRPPPVVLSDMDGPTLRPAHEDLPTAPRSFKQVPPSPASPASAATGDDTDTEPRPTVLQPTASVGDDPTEVPVPRFVRS